MAIPKLTSYLLPTATELPANKVKWTLDPQRAALLIHDMQAYFLNFWGENSPLVNQVVENIARLRAYSRWTVAYRGRAAEGALLPGLEPPELRRHLGDGLLSRRT